MLFWGEGSKQRNGVAFTNSDVEMMRFFLRFLRQSYGVEDERIRLRINCHLGNGHSVAEIESWWLDQLGLPRSCLRTSVVNRPSRSSSRAQLTSGYETLMVAPPSTSRVVPVM